MIEQFHFLRPGWLLLMLPLAALLWRFARGRYDNADWRAVVDSRLLPFVLSGADGARHAWTRWILALAALLSIVALAGPTWEKLPQPVYQKQTSLVILLDLSRSMNVADIRPGRLARARLKIIDILKFRKEGQTALVVYAADAFTVTPLTSDVETIMALLPDLDSTLMPAQGSRADRAFELAYRLFANADVARGDLLLVSDGVDSSVLERIESLRAGNPGHRISVLAVGTSEGGPVPLPNGGFLKAADGSIVISALGEDNLRRIAHDGDGVYATISNDDIDVNTLTYLMESAIESGEADLAEDRRTEQWRELGPWLLLLALPLGALAFRRGMAWVLPLCFLVLPPDAEALDWQSWWQNDDQRASRLFEQGEHAAAARLFDDPDWKASSQYRAGDYQAALENWSRLDGDSALYNRGNALARMQRYEEALAAYDELLARRPEHADALHNKRAIEDFLQRQPPQPGDQQQSGERQQSGQQQAGDSEEQRQEDAQQNGQQQPQTGQSGAAGHPQSAEQESADDSAQAANDGRQDETGQNDAGSAPQPESGGETSPAQQAGTAQDGHEQDFASLDEKMSAQAAEQWLRKIPDDPGGLLRRKFRYQYRERGGVAAETQTW